MIFKTHILYYYTYLLDISLLGMNSGLLSPQSTSVGHSLWRDIFCPPRLQAPQRPFKVGERVRYWLPDYKMGGRWM